MNPYPPRPPQPSSTARTLLAVLVVALGLWIVVATWILQLGAWAVGEVSLGETGRPAGAGVWLGAAWTNAFVVAGPAALLAVLTSRVAPDSQGVLVAARAWAVAGVLGALLGSARAVPILHNEIFLAVTTVVAVLLTLVLARFPRANRPHRPAGRLAGGFGSAAGLVVLLPWLWVGALGGLLETVLAVTAALAVGRLAASLLGVHFFAAFGRSRAWLILVGGLAAGVALVPVAGGLGAGGLPMAELLVLPPLGFLVAVFAAAGPMLVDGGHLPRRQVEFTPAAARRAVPWERAATPTALMLGVAAAGPLAFVDPEETSLLLGDADVGYWAAVASLLAAGLALVVSALFAWMMPWGRSFHRWVPVSLAALVAVAATGVYAFAGQPGLYGDRLFVILKEQADLTGLATITDRPARLRGTYERLVSHAERSQQPIRSAIAGWGLDYQPYYLVNAVSLRGGPLVREWLADHPDVDRVLLEQDLRPLPVEPESTSDSTGGPAPGPQWNVSLIGADRAWSEFGSTGQGIVIGQSDSGVDGAHPALRQGFRGGDDGWYDPWNRTAVPTDHNGHGTHTLGSALGRDGVGVAPAAQWVGCVNLDRNLGSPRRYLDCLQFMLAPFPTGGDPWRDGRPDRAPHVLTNSWGCPDLEGCDAAALAPATAALRAAGIFFVGAAGNTGPRCGSLEDPPAPYGDVLSVGAVDRQRQVAGFSSRGPAPGGAAKPDLTAPGVDILSAWPGGGYAKASGTSMATPHVAGVVALMWSANPRLVGDVDATARILRDTAEPVAVGSREAGACGGVANVVGAGLVNAYAAVAAARTASP